MLVDWSQEKHDAGRSYRKDDISITIHHAYQIIPKRIYLQIPRLVEELALVKETCRNLDLSVAFSFNRYGIETDPLSVGVANVSVGIPLYSLKGAKAFTIGCELADLKVVFRETAGNGVPSCVTN